MRRVFIDGGANTGISINLFLKKYPDANHLGISINLFLKKYPDANQFEIHSFEPNPELVKSLSKYKGIATIHNKALSSRDDVLDFYLGGSLSSTLRTDKVSGNIKYGNPIKVQSVDLAKFITENFSKEDYIVLKLDVEGAEYEIIPHLLTKGIFDGWVDDLFGEWHAHKLATVSSSDHSKIVTSLQRKGFRMKEWDASINKIEI